MSKNAEGWIRHRGGKCPVEVGTLIDIRRRDGLVRNGVPCGKDFTRTSSMFWMHDGDGAEVMAYRLHKPAEQVEACSKPDPRDSAKRDSDYVCWMRDRITEIDATTRALTAERAELVQKLASEGCALIGRVVEPVENMSDPKNWREGDCFVQTAEDLHGAKKGELWVMSQDDGTTAKAYVRENGDEWYVANSHLKFHSRPSA